MSTDFSNTNDVIDVRDVIERFEELEEEKETFVEKITDLREEMEEAKTKKEKKSLLKQIDELGEWSDTEEGEEYTLLESLLNELRGSGGDEQWRGDWYPVTLVRDTYFTEYTREMLEDCGYIPKDFPSWIEVDWESTAENCKVDYQSVDYDGVDYWYR